MDTRAANDQLEHERDLDRLLQIVDSELADISGSEIFQRCAWIDRVDADACEPDPAISLFALRGPPTMSIIIRDDEADPENRTILCRVENPRDGSIQLDPIRPAV
jgi:hypothetical protein